MNAPFHGTEKLLDDVMYCQIEPQDFKDYITVVWNNNLQIH